jgi:hypothetical protein
VSTRQVWGTQPLIDMRDNVDLLGLFEKLLLPLVGAGGSATGVLITDKSHRTEQ